jgi:hypothetical protein
LLSSGVSYVQTDQRAYPVVDKELVKDGEEVKGLDKIGVLVEKTTDFLVALGHNVKSIGDSSH